MAKSQEEKDAIKAAKAAMKKAVTKFKLSTTAAGGADGKPFNVHVEDDNIDKHVESSHEGIFRKA